jgi:hypothetical protein
MNIVAKIPAFDFERPIFSVRIRVIRGRIKLPMLSITLAAKRKYRLFGRPLYTKKGFLFNRHTP